MELEDYLKLQNKRHKPHRQEESDIQMRLAFLLTTQYPDVIFTTSPAGVKLTIGQAMKMKRMGYRSGTPDLMIFKPTSQFKALFLEIKTLGGKSQKNQVDLAERLNALGYKAVITYGFNEALQTIKEYLTQTKGE